MVLYCGLGLWYDTGAAEELNDRQQKGDYTVLWIFVGIFIFGLIAEMVFGNPRKGIKKKHWGGAYSGRSARVERPQVFEDTDDEDSEDEDWFSEAAQGKRLGGSYSGRAVRVERPHVIEDTDYECSVCGSRFSEAASVCPCCGARFEGKQKDWEEFDLEEDELESWDEEDGL